MGTSTMEGTYKHTENAPVELAHHRHFSFLQRPAFTLHVVTDVVEAKRLWEMFSPKRELFELWEMRYAFFKACADQLKFFVAERNGEPVALLPLEVRRGGDTLEFFGTPYMEGNMVYHKPGAEAAVTFLYQSVPGPADLADLVAQDEFSRNLPVRDYKYVLRLRAGMTADNILEQQFTGKTLATMRRNLRKLSDQHVLQVERGTPEDLPVMFALNQQAFGATSRLRDAWRQQIYYDLVEAGLQVHILRFLVDGKLAAVSTGVFHNGTFSYMNAGTNTWDYPNLGNFLIAKNMEYAAQIGSHTFDAMVGSFNWKERWHMAKIPQHQLVLTAPTQPKPLLVPVPLVNRVLA